MARFGLTLLGVTTAVVVACTSLPIAQVGATGTGDGSAGGFDPMAATGGFDPLAGTGRGGYDPLAPGGGVTPPAAAPELAPEFGNLPRGDGVELVFALCSACHGLDIITQQRMTDDRWAYTLDWMSREQGMPELPAEFEEMVLAYLTTHFSSER